MLTLISLVDDHHVLMNVYKMEKLIEALCAYGKLNSTEIALINSYSKTLNLEKGVYFSESGKVVNKIGFLIEGIMCVRYYGVDGKDITKYFIVENHFAGYSAIKLSNNIQKSHY